jgi:hypothetical protein
MVITQLSEALKKIMEISDKNKFGQPIIFVNKGDPDKVEIRKAPKIDEYDLEDLFIKQASQVLDIDPPLYADDPGIYETIFSCYDYQKVGKMQNDLSKIRFEKNRFSNSIDLIQDEKKVPQYIAPTDFNIGLNTAPNGLIYEGANIEGNLTIPIYFIIYWDGENIRCYVPMYGNTFNGNSNMPLGSDVVSDAKFLANEYGFDLQLEEKDDYATFFYTFYRCICPDYKLMMEDILMNITVVETKE